MKPWQLSPNRAADPWLRSVAANPLADPELVFDAARQAALDAQSAND